MLLTNPWPRWQKSESEGLDSQLAILDPQRQHMLSRAFLFDHWHQLDTIPTFSSEYKVDWISRSTACQLWPTFFVKWSTALRRPQSSASLEMSSDTKWSSGFNRQSDERSKWCRSIIEWWTVAFVCTGKEELSHRPADCSYCGSVGVMLASWHYGKSYPIAVNNG
jgi:hypothetical protein